jgi:hypothetical protein
VQQQPAVRSAVRTDLNTVGVSVVDQGFEAVGPSLCVYCQAASGIVTDPAVAGDSLQDSRGLAESDGASQHSVAAWQQQATVTDARLWCNPRL